jgi:hypothetical protein
MGIFESSSSSSGFISQKSATSSSPSRSISFKKLAHVSQFALCLPGKSMDEYWGLGTCLRVRMAWSSQSRWSRRSCPKYINSSICPWQGTSGSLMRLKRWWSDSAWWAAHGLQMTSSPSVPSS